MNESADNGALGAQGEDAITQTDDQLRYSDEGEVISENQGEVPKETESALKLPDAEEAKGQTQGAAENSTEEKLTGTKAFSAALNRASEKRSREMLEKLKKEYLEQSPAVRAAREIIEKNTLREDLAQIKAAYPDISFDDPRKIGEVYVKLMRTGQVDALTAYEAQLSYEKRTIAPLPPMPGSAAAGAGGGEKDYYSPTEAKALSREDYKKDPSLMDKVRASMTKWR